jgi:hypothetical protein
MTTIIAHSYGGRLGNQIIRNIAVSLIAEKFNLQVSYSSQPFMDDLGIPLYHGTHVHEETRPLTESNYFDVLDSDTLDYNLNPNKSFFQTTRIVKRIYQYVQDHQTSIMEKNPHQERYKTNNDVFVHIRLTDVKQYSPGLHYYQSTIKKVGGHTLYISTDEKTHDIVTSLTNMYPEAIVMDADEVKTIQFASTCKHVILSHGSFSSIIGYFSFFSDVYYPNHTSGKIWYGDLCCIPSWTKCSI